MHSPTVTDCSHFLLQALPEFGTCKFIPGRVWSGSTSEGFCMHTGTVILSGPGYWMGFPFREEAEVKGNEYRSELLTTKMGSPQADRRGFRCCPLLADIRSQCGGDFKRLLEQWGSEHSSQRMLAEAWDRDRGRGLCIMQWGESYHSPTTNQKLPPFYKYINTFSTRCG